MDIVTQTNSLLPDRLNNLLKGTSNLKVEGKTKNEEWNWRSFLQRVKDWDSSKDSKKDKDSTKGEDCTTSQPI